MSLHMAISKRGELDSWLLNLVCIAFFFLLVCVTCLKTIAMSFYTLNNKDETTSQNSDETASKMVQKNFINPFISVINFVRMSYRILTVRKLTLKINKYTNKFDGIILLLFIILISVVLLNLLNALAIRYTNKITKDAGLVDSNKRVSILSSYETLIFPTEIMLWKLKVLRKLRTLTLPERFLVKFLN